MLSFRLLSHRMMMCCALLCLAIFGHTSHAQNIPGIDNNIRAGLLAEGPASPGQEVMLAIHFEPVSTEWHGYWKNPGDAGYGMRLEWDLPDGWEAGEPQYPVPTKLLIGDLMNHIFEGSYAVLIPISVPEGAASGGVAEIGLKANWLACTDVICVPEKGEMQLAIPVGQGDYGDARFAGWKSAIPPMIDSGGAFQIRDETLRLVIPLPSGFSLSDTHIFLAERELGDGL